MTVRELLTTISTILKTHEVVTLTNASTMFIIDIEHNHYFHAVGRYTKSAIETAVYPEFMILKPFERTIFKDYNDKQYSILDDFEVYRWKLYQKGDSYEWCLDIETKST